MSIAKNILTYLEHHKIGYKIIPHKKVYTTFDLAATLKEDLGRISKSLLVKADKRYVIVVLPSHVRLDLPKAKKVLDAAKVAIVSEKEMLQALGMKMGTLHPFGGMHGLQVAFDKELSKAKKVIMRSGSFDESLDVPVKEYIKVEKPLVAALGEKIKGFAKKFNVPKKKTVKRRPKLGKKAAAKKFAAKKAAPKKSKKKK